MEGEVELDGVGWDGMGVVVVVVVDATLSNYLPGVSCFVVENGVRCSIRGRRFGLFFFFGEKTARAFSAIARGRHLLLV